MVTRWQLKVSTPRTWIGRTLTLTVNGTMAFAREIVLRTATS